MKPEIVNREPLLKKETLEDIIKVGTTGLIAYSLGMFSRYILPEIVEYNKIINGETKAVLEHYLAGIGIPAVMNIWVRSVCKLANNPPEEKCPNDVEKIRKKVAETLGILSTIGLETSWEIYQVGSGEPAMRSIYQLTGDYLGISTYTYFLARETGKEILSTTRNFLNKHNPLKK